MFTISFSSLGQYYELHQHEIQSPCENVLYLNCGKTVCQSKIEPHNSPFVPPIQKQFFYNYKQYKGSAYWKSQGHKIFEL